MRAIVLPPLPPPEAIPSKPKGQGGGPRAKKPRNPTSTPSFVGTVSERWLTHLGYVTSAVLAESGAWHPLFLALSGAMLRRGVPPAEVPALIRIVSAACSDTKTADRERAAKDTVEKFYADRPFAAYSQLRVEWPRVADAVDIAFPAGAIDETPKENLVAEAAGEALQAEIHAARTRPGLTLIAAACGLGKTHAAELDAIACVADGIRTGYSADKHALVSQVTEHIRAAGIPVCRHFSPFSEHAPSPCPFREFGGLLSQGRQSAIWELCEGGHSKLPCQHYEQCTARIGCEGPVDALVHTGVHQHMAEIDGALRIKDLLIVDELGPMLESENVMIDRLKSAIDRRGCFDERYGTAMRPALEALKMWLSESEIGDFVLLSEAVQRCAESIGGHILGAAEMETGTADPIACARLAHYPDRKRKFTTPPLRRGMVSTMRENPTLARSVSSASRLYSLVWRALQPDSEIKVRTLLAGGNRLLVITGPEELVQRTLAREGSVVVIDANAELRKPELARVLGYDPHFRAFDAPDGARISRHHMMDRRCTRRALFCEGKLRTAEFTAKVRRAVAWALEGPCTKVGLITYRAAREAIDQALDPGTGESDLADALAPIANRLALGHYGALRGLDTMSACDVIITIGDPRVNLDFSRHEHAYLDLDVDHGRRYDALARAELEQAHGRGRTIHRRTSMRALHIGALLPSGSGWTRGVQIVPLASGPAPRAATIGSGELERAIRALGGVRATARVLGLDHTNLIRMCSGARPMPPATLARLRGLTRPSTIEASA